MDTSKTYIKMCDCEEIQKDVEEVGGTWIGGSILYHIAPMNQPHNKDGYYHVTDEEAIRTCETCGNKEPYIKSSKYIWLPRQDQLQEMLDWTNINTLLAEVLDFASFPESYGKHPDPQIETLVYKWNSMEQLWLAFVMKEKYNKVRDGENWLKQ